MNCKDYDEPLGDYVAGALDPVEREALEAHLHVCGRCRAVAADFAAISAMSRELEPLTPAPHVWRSIAAATARPGARAWRPHAWAAGWQPVFAAAMALVLTTGLWWVGARLAETMPATIPVSAVAAIEDVDAPQGAEAHFTTAIARLEEVASAERSALDPDTADVLDAGLYVIDTAIGESRATLETQPENELAQQSLVAALDRKVAVLQDMLALINDTRRANGAGGVDLLPELN